MSQIDKNQKCWFTDGGMIFCFTKIMCRFFCVGGEKANSVRRGGGEIGQRSNIKLYGEIYWFVFMERGGNCR